MRPEGRGPGGKPGPPPSAQRTRDEGGDETPSVPHPPDSPEREPGVTPRGFRCDLCGGKMLDRHCKLVCTSCGYQRDCSDP